MFNYVQNVAWIGRNSVKLLQNEKVKSVDNDCTNNNARNTSQATNNNHGQVDDGVSSVKRRWCYSPQFRRVESTCNTREESTRSKSKKLCPYQINARGSCCDLIFAHSYPGTS